MLCCNRCRKDLQIGSSFKTACRHVFCEACANQSFSSDCICPICKQRLQSQDVSEFLVGINPAVPVQENIFQAAFQDASTSAVLENTSKILHAVSELIKFVNSQVSDQSEAAAEDLIRLEQTIEQNRNESVSVIFVLISRPNS